MDIVAPSPLPVPPASTRGMARPGTGRVTFRAGEPLVASCVDSAARLLARFGVTVAVLASSGSQLEAGQAVLEVEGDLEPAPLQAVLRRLRRTCGTASAARGLLRAARRGRFDADVAFFDRSGTPVCPRTRQALRDGGIAVGPGLLAHALDIRDFMAGDDPAGILKARALHAAAPTVLRARHPCEVDATVLALADTLVLDGFLPEGIRAVRDRSFGRVPRLTIAAAGMIDESNAADYARAGARLLITAASLAERSVDVALGGHGDGN